MDDDVLKQRITSMPAPKVTEEYIGDRIKDVRYWRLTGTLTVCVITVNNGFTVTGESACASPENYNQEIGEALAFKHAMGKLWPLFGFLLCEKLYQKELTKLQNELKD